MTSLDPNPISAPPQEHARPDARGRFGAFGGRYVPETLVPALERLERGYAEATASAEFQAALVRELRQWAGRPTALTRAERLGTAWGCELWLKREDLAHTGAHKINNAVGQALLAQRLGAKRVVAETGAGQHGVATAAACARLGIPCRVYQGSLDVARQAPNARRMRLFGAELVPVDINGQPGTLRAAIDEALRDWVSDPDGTYYLLGSAVGPHPYPRIVRDLQAAIGREARAQLLDATGQLPDAVVACVGGGSNAIGSFHPFVGDREVALLGIEAGGDGRRHGATLTRGRPGVLHGTLSYLLHDEDGQVLETHSVSAGLDYPGVGPEHSFLKDSGRADYLSVTDAEALDALQEVCRLEGILPALETAHAFAGARRAVTDLRDRLGRTPRILLTCSGRGDKDLGILEDCLGTGEATR